MPHLDRDIPTDLQAFVAELAVATNSHDFDRVAPFIHPEAIYWFTGGREFRGVDQIREAFVDTWARIQSENYIVNNVEWPLVTPSSAVYTYDFRWRGIIDGRSARGNGRGTNVLLRNEDRWQVVHEHLSKSE